MECSGSPATSLRLPIANASLLDEATAAGEAMALNLPELGVIPSARDAQALSPVRPLLGLRRGRTELGIVNNYRNAPLLNESFRAALTSIL